MSAQRVVVIGAGQMGTGIAIVAARAGYHVHLLDKFESARSKSGLFIQSWTEKERSKGRLPQETSLHVRIEDLHSASLRAADPFLVIEAVPEILQLKQDLLSFVSDSLDHNVLIASNTSSLSITRLAASIKQPSRFLGLHFMNPVPVMPLVEVVRGLHTSDSALNSALLFIESIKKDPATSLDRPGFVANRLLMPYINEAIFALQEGVASRDDIDKIMRLGTNVPMGPLALADFIGLDTCLHIMRVMHTEFADSKYRPAPLLVQMVDGGLLGKKSGSGFFKYK